MTEDAEGFLYPTVEASVCDNCGLCEQVCPMLFPREVRTPLRVWSAKNPDMTIRMNSSSGGVFYPLAESVLVEGGVVCGAAFDTDWSVRHELAEDQPGMTRFMGSKYPQSRMDDCYKRVEKILKDGRTVLFTGTPCQIAGLKSYLGRDYPHLLTADIVCHGVPSPKIWRDYLQSQGLSPIESVSFRDKSNGWNKFGLSVRSKAGGNLLEDHNDNLYMKGFLKNLYLRPSCYACFFREGRSGSDLTLGDFWGVQKTDPSFDDDRGVSLVLSYSDKGESLFQSLKLETRQVAYEQALIRNSCIERSVRPHPNRTQFFAQYPKQGIKAIARTLPLNAPLLKRIVRKFKSLFRK